jgi:hypothetical protein
MANNFLGKLRNLVSSTWSETDNVHVTHTPVATSTISGKQSSVEKYLARQGQTSTQAVSDSKALTGVDKYLAKNITATPGATAKAPLTSVDKYLAKQAGAPITEAAKPAPAAPLSKVDKYLASQNASKEQAATTPEKKAEPVKKTEAPVKAAAAAKKKSEAVEKPEAAKKETTKKAVEVKEAPQKDAEKVEISAKPKKSAVTKPVDITDLSTGATQCQAGTTKGTQCRNTLRLNQLQLDISGKTYLFAACNQHNNDTFKPFQQIQ